MFFYISQDHNQRWHYWENLQEEELSGRKSLCLLSLSDIETFSSSSMDLLGLDIFRRSNWQRSAFIYTSIPMTLVPSLFFPPLSFPVIYFQRMSSGRRRSERANDLVDKRTLHLTRRCYRALGSLGNSEEPAQNLQRATE